VLLSKNRVFDGHGTLSITDIVYGRVFRVDAVGASELVAEWDGEPNGLALLGPDRVAHDRFSQWLMVLDTVSGTVTALFGSAQH
jgi:gluconolactonase